MARTKARNIKSEERDVKALELRVRGATYEQIADALGYGGRANAHHAVTGILERREAEGADHLRAEGQGRYELVIRTMMGILTDSGQSNTDRVKAADRIIRAQNSLNRLFGLNLETPLIDARTQTLIVEAETLTENMRAALASSGDAPPPADDDVVNGEIVDVVEVDDE